MLSHQALNDKVHKKILIDNMHSLFFFHGYAWDGSGKVIMIILDCMDLYSSIISFSAMMGASQTAFSVVVTDNFSLRF